MYPGWEIFPIHLISSGLLNLNPPRRHLHRQAVATRSPQRSFFFLWVKVGAATRRLTLPQLGTNKCTVSLKTTNVNSTSKIQEGLFMWLLILSSLFPPLVSVSRTFNFVLSKGFRIEVYALDFPDILWITKLRRTVLCVVSVFTLDNKSQMC